MRLQGSEMFPALISMKKFEKKSVIFLGPATDGLTGFDYSCLSAYDYVARTNLFLNSDTTDYTLPENRCNILCLNKYSFEVWKDQNLFEQYTDLIYVVKFDSHLEYLKSLQLEAYSIQTIKQKIKKITKTEPYLGTAAINFLTTHFNVVDVNGFSFYSEGFGDKSKYIDGYVAYTTNSSGEESLHSMCNDVKYLKSFINKNTNLQFLQPSVDLLTNYT